MLRLIKIAFSLWWTKTSFFELDQVIEEPLVRKGSISTSSQGTGIVSTVVSWHFQNIPGRFDERRVSFKDVWSFDRNPIWKNDRDSSERMGHWDDRFLTLNLDGDWNSLVFGRYSNLIFVLWNKFELFWLVFVGRIFFIHGLATNEQSLLSKLTTEINVIVIIVIYKKPGQPGKIPKERERMKFMHVASYCLLISCTITGLCYTSVRRGDSLHLAIIIIMAAIIIIILFFNSASNYFSCALSSVQKRQLMKNGNHREK